MAFCTKCGKEIVDGSAFCSVCGAPMNPEPASEAPPKASYAYQPPVMPGGQPVGGANDIQANKAMAILAYIIFFVPLIAGVHRTSPFAKYHTNQGTILFIFNCAFGVTFSIFSAILSAIFSFGLGAWAIYNIIMTLLGILWLVPVAFIVLGIINAANGACKPLPFIGNFTIIK
ncbi:MAG: zinc-ribbon domain-containing protein [Coriobacteriia bacterium]|nr:zinc-ribbon domain-containing protein [Coriobacteriia bacterium]